MSTPKIKPETVQAIQDELQLGTKYPVIAKKLRVGTGTISNVATGKIGTGLNEEMVAARLKVNLQEQKEKYREALRVIERLRRVESTINCLYSERKKLQSVRIEPKRGGKKEATAMISVADWHLEEVINKEAVNNVNEFNPTVGKQRVKMLWSSVAGLVDMCRSRSRIDTVVVMVLGDLITGYIHDELMATNSTPPTEAVVRAYNLLASGLEFLRKEIKAKLIVPCVCGNHGRFTKKRWSKGSVGVNFEGILYSMLADRFSKDSDITIIPPRGDMTYITVYGRTIRIMHGDNIQYQGGIGGVHIPLRKALDVWNSQVRADYNYLGHWHTDLTGEDYRISGSLCGYSEWSLRIKARFQRPSQAFELQHPRYGATARFPIILG